VSIQAVGFILDHSTASGSARWVLISLANHARGWDAWPSVELIAYEAGLTERTVQHALAGLERDGHIVRTINGAPDLRIPNGRKPNLYQISDEPTRRCFRGCPMCAHLDDDGVLSDATPQDDEGCRATTRRGVVSQRVGVSSDDANRELALISLEPSLEPSTEPRVVVDFDAFWIAYPRRTAKRAAQLAWKKAITRAEPEQIIAGAARYAIDPNRDETFTAHPASWLNDDRWLDEPLPPRTKNAQTAQRRDRLVVTDRSLPSGRITL
jgi:hypothetical protein